MEVILVIVVQNNVVQTTESFNRLETDKAEACYLNELDKHSSSFTEQDKEYALEEGSMNVTKENVVTGVNLVWT